MPALVDVHVHINDPAPAPTSGSARVEWEGFPSASRAAAAGGIALLVDMPLNSEPVTTTVAALDAKSAPPRGRSLVDVAFYGGVVPANADDRRGSPIWRSPASAAFKCFLCDSGLRELPAARPRRARARRWAISPASAAGCWRTRSSSRPSLPTSQLGRRYADYLASRPPSAEVARDRAPRRARPRAPAARSTSSTSPPPRRCRCSRARRAEGLDITVETCPHYLTFAAEEIADGDTVSEVRAADSRRGEPRALWRGLERRRHRLRRDRPLPLPAGDEGAARAVTSAPPGAGSPRCSFCLPAGLDRGTRGAATGLERLGAVARRTGRRAGSGLPDRGAIRPGRAPTSSVLDPEARFVVAAPRCTTAIR